MVIDVCNHLIDFSGFCDIMFHGIRAVIIGPADIYQKFRQVRCRQGRTASLPAAPGFGHVCTQLAQLRDALAVRTNQPVVFGRCIGKTGCEIFIVKIFQVFKKIIGKPDYNALIRLSRTDI